MKLIIGKTQEGLYRPSAAAYIQFRNEFFHDARQTTENP